MTGFLDWLTSKHPDYIEEIDKTGKFADSLAEKITDAFGTFKTMSKTGPLTVMASVRQILSRLRAITNICRITRTMEMMSTAKYKAYRERLSDTVDFYDALAQAAFLLFSSYRACQPSSAEGKFIRQSCNLCHRFRQRALRLIQ